MRRLRAYLDRQVCRHPPSSCPKSNRAQGRRNSLFARWRCGRNRTAVETRGRGICSNRRYRSASPVSSALSPALPVRDKDLGSERHLLAEIPLNQPAGKRETTVAGCVHQRHAAAPVSGPRAKAFLHPKGTLYHVSPTPRPLAALPVGTSNIINVPIMGRCFVSCTNRYLIPSSISPKPKARGPTPAGVKAGIVFRQNRRGGNDDVDVDIGKSSPVELQGRPKYVGFHRGAIRSREHIELVVSEFNWLRIVCLKRRTGQCRRRSRNQQRKRREHSYCGDLAHPATSFH